MSKPPTPLRIPELLLDGFAAESAAPGQRVRVVVTGRFTSDQPLFHVYAIQISRSLTQHLRTFLPHIDRLLVLIHKDNSADVYVNNFDVTAEARVTRTVKAGEPLTAPDLSDIHSVTFRDVGVHPDDKIIYVGRHEWRFGLYFNFTREIAGNKWSTDLANLMSELLLRDFLAVTDELLATKSPVAYDTFVVTEGKTDWRHLKKAAETLGVCGIEFDETDRDRGDSLLLSVCKEMAVVPQLKPVIFIFDRDNEQIVRQLENDAKYRNWGNNVFSMLLPVPEHRMKYRRISIEMYYPDEILRRPDSAGRRLCFDNELKKEIHPDKSVRRILITPDTGREYEKMVVGQDVDNIEDGDGRKVALSKTAFAEHVFYRRSPYDDLEFEEFRPVFQIIGGIVKAGRTA